MSHDKSFVVFITQCSFHDRILQAYVSLATFKRQYVSPLVSKNILLQSQTHYQLQP